MAHICRIEIDALWAGGKRVVWHLHKGVNILSGVNGAGKSTILKRLWEPTAGVRVVYWPEGVTGLPFDFIQPHSPSELSTKLYEVQERFRAFCGGPYRREDLLDLFYGVLDDLFSDTGKWVVREGDGLLFRQGEEVLGPEVLSSGEKHILILLVTLLCERGEPCVVIMDEPEYSLHFDWQRRLLGIVVRMNSEAQVILTTHSPAIVMDGWADCVTDVADIVDG